MPAADSPGSVREQSWRSWTSVPVPAHLEGPSSAELRGLCLQSFLTPPARPLSLHSSLEELGIGHSLGSMALQVLSNISSSVFCVGRVGTQLELP